MARTEYKFQYMPLEGRLPGKVMEQQTEDAINDLGIWVVDVSETAESAIAIAQDAYDRSVDAQSTADKAQSAADAAQATADEAMRAAENAQSAGDGAQASADEAMAAAKAAQESADQAQDAADRAQDSANTAQGSADKAQETADAAQESADAAKTSADMAQQTADDALTQLSDVRGEVDSIMTYEVVGGTDEETGEAEIIDLNDYNYFARIHVPVGTLNAPADDEEFFVDCDLNSDGTEARQVAIGIESKNIWVRYASITEEVEPDEENPEDTPEPARADGEDDDGDGDSPDDDEPETVWGAWKRQGGDGSSVYDVVENIDLNDYTDSAKLYAINCTNAPTTDSEYFIDVDIDSKDNTIRQRATKVETPEPSYDGGE